MALVESNGDVSHQIIGSYFIGPKAENLGDFHKCIEIILDELKQARDRYFGEDESFINALQNTPAFKQSMEKLKVAVRKTAQILGKTSVPFFHPRYEAHMCTDLSMASLLDTHIRRLFHDHALISNPNNVALEASPFSTVAEIEVGEQLCELFGFSNDPDDLQSPTGWGHITCGGTVANLESIWAARNLKYYPLSFQLAIKSEKLDFIADRFFIETCDGTVKLFSQLSPWELLNLKPHDILDIPDRLYQEHGISNAFLSDLMKNYSIQSIGKGRLEHIYGLFNQTPGDDETEDEKKDTYRPAQYLLATTRHYSWPKGAAIAGVGSDNVIGIPVDNAARVDITDLETRLERNLRLKQPVLCVVAIIGSTEEGSVDSLSSILALRKQFQTRGLSFLVHADAAWGGYFCSMLPKSYNPGDVLNLPTEMGEGDGFVPDSSLRVETQDDLYAIRFADSVTVDPHKAGYIPYPAGALCYRDGRMRFLNTWTSPYLSRGSVTSIGIYGVEGSKPGAAAVSTWLSNRVIGLTQEGYGTLLGEVSWTCSRLSAEWASITNSVEFASRNRKNLDASTEFFCVPLNELPSEAGEEQPPTPEKIARIENEKTKIRNEIVNKTNSQIIAAAQSSGDTETLKLLRAIGSDLNINAFALNFKTKDGVNKDVEEANYLMKRVVQAFSVESPGDDPTKIPFYLTSTEFSDDLYGKCKTRLMKRLGLDASTQDLMVLRNVVMSPFPSDGGFIRKMAKIFEEGVLKEVEIVRKRNEISEDFHKFLIQGSKKLYLIHMPMFHVANHRQQLIISVEFDTKSLEIYQRLKKSNPTEPMLLVTQEKIIMKDLVNPENLGEFVGQIKTEASGIILKGVEVKITQQVVSRPLNSKFRLPSYPGTIMPFYLYGSSEEANIDHVIVKAPNTQLSAGRCVLNVSGIQDKHWDQPLLLILQDFREGPMQPFPPNTEIGTKHGAVIAHEDVDAPRRIPIHGVEPFHQDDAAVKPASAAESNGDIGRNDLKRKAGSDGTGNATDNGVRSGDPLGADAASGIGASNGNASNIGVRSGDPLGADAASGNGVSNGTVARNGETNGSSTHTLSTGAAIITSETRSGRVRGSKFFFRPRAKFTVSVYEDKHRFEKSSATAILPEDEQKNPLHQNVKIGEGTLTLGESVFVDSEAMNFDPFGKVERVAEWRHELDQVGKAIDEQSYLSTAYTVGTSFRSNAGVVG